MYYNNMDKLNNLTSESQENTQANEEEKIPLSDPRVILSLIEKIKELDHRFVMISEYVHQIKDIIGISYEDISDWSERLNKEQKSGKEPDYKLRTKSGIIL